MQTLAPVDRLFGETARGTVFLFQPQWLDDADGPRRFPYRMLPLLGALRANGWRVVFAEEAFDGSPEESWRDHLRDATAAVAWCGELYPGTQIPGVLRFLEALRFEGGPPLLAGGGFFPLVATEELALDAADAVVLEPGELVLPLALDAIAKGHDVAGVSGVATWSRDGWRRNPAPPASPLDAAWYEPLRDLDLERYGAHAERLIFDDDGPAFQLVTGLGCAKRCVFCFDQNAVHRVFPAEAVVDAVAQLSRERGFSRILLGELDFLQSRARARSIARGLRSIREDTPDLRWFALGSIVDLLRCDDADLDLFAQAGMWRLEMGAESGSATHLRRLGKRHAPEDAVTAARRLAERGIRSTFNLLLGAPGETGADRRATLRLASRLAASSDLVRVQPRRYQLVPTTTMGDRALADVDDVPRTLAEIATWRATPEDAAWISPRGQREVRDLVEYILPMAFERPPAASMLRRVLRRVARLRCRTGIDSLIDFERGVWERAVAVGREPTPLPGTYVR